MRQNKTKQLLDYWLNLFRECNTSENVVNSPLWPDRRSIQPAQCRALLSEMFILESFGGPYHYRLAGTNLCSLYGRELKREEFSNAFIGADRGSAEDWLSGLYLEEQVVLICSMAQLDSGLKINLETLLLPLSNSSGSGRRILGITVPHDGGNIRPRGVIITQAIRSVRVLRPWEEKAGSIPVGQDLNKRDDLTAGNGRIDMVAPPLFSKSDKFLTTFETNESAHQYKRVGHLVVIDGGRGQDTHDK